MVVGTIIGSGIFLVPAEMMQAVGSAKLVYLAWVVGGLLSFAGALTYAELGAMKPQAGGEYVYVRDGYGPLGGFLYAWTWFVIAKPASIATLSPGWCEFWGRFSIFSFFSDNVITAPFAVTWGQMFAIAAADSDFVAELSGREEGGRISAGVYAAESGDHPGNRGGVLQRNWERVGSGMEQFCGNVRGRQGRESRDSWRRWWRRSGRMTDGTI